MSPTSAIRVVNVVDLMALQPQSEHPHGMEDQDFDKLFTTDKPVIFAFHGYPGDHPQADLPAAQSRQHPRARLQGRRHHDDALRHGRCSTISTATSLRWTPSAGFPDYTIRSIQQQRVTGPSWNVTSSMSANTVRTCPRCRTGAGPRGRNSHSAKYTSPARGRGRDAKRRG